VAGSCEVVSVDDHGLRARRAADGGDPPARPASPFRGGWRDLGEAIRGYRGLEPVGGRM